LLAAQVFWISLWLWVPLILTTLADAVYELSPIAATTNMPRNLLRILASLLGAPLVC
jgi:hypothetical protein